MDRNLERNLAKVNAWRARGDLPKARRRLAELVQEHPDTPDYRLDLARVCLDLGDSHAALGEVRLLLRQLPDRRDELLAAVEEHFQASGNLPAGQLKESQCARLCDSIRAVLAEAVEFGSTVPLQWNGPTPHGQ